MGNGCIARFEQVRRPCDGDFRAPARSPAGTEPAGCVAGRSDIGPIIHDHHHPQRRGRWFSQVTKPSRAHVSPGGRPPRQRRLEVLNWTKPGHGFETASIPKEDNGWSVDDAPTSHIFPPGGIVYIVRPAQMQDPVRPSSFSKTVGTGTIVDIPLRPAVDDDLAAIVAELRSLKCRESLHEVIVTVGRKDVGVAEHRGSDTGVVDDVGCDAITQTLQDGGGVVVLEVIVTDDTPADLGRIVRSTVDADDRECVSSDCASGVDDTVVVKVEAPWECAVGSPVPAVTRPRIRAVGTSASFASVTTVSPSVSISLELLFVSGHTPRVPSSPCALGSPTKVCRMTSPQVHHVGHGGQAKRHRREH